MRTFDLELLISTDTIPITDDALRIVPIDDACSGFDLIVTYFDRDEKGRFGTMTRRLSLLNLVVGEPR